MNYIKIDKTIKKAFYLQIKDSIEDAIKKGILSDNDRLPTESELCEVYGISDIVVKNAYKLLVKEGYIIRVQGSGTFVSTRKIYRFPLAGFDKLSSFSSYGPTPSS
jgi:DNA-binding GntR family transcriptional regulator